MRFLFKSLLILLAGAFIARADANIDRTAPPPVIPGLNADPNIAVFGDTFYLYPTTDGFEGWRSTSFRAWSSRDLVHWKNEGVILDLPRDLGWASGHAWAPTIAAKNGKYYFYYSADQNIGVAVGNSPVGPFKDPLGRPLVAKKDFQGMQAIDPVVFVDDDGTAYLYWGQGRCKAVKLNDDMISFNMADVRDLTLPGYNEGPFVHKRKGTYYLSWSEFDTRDPRYSVAYATSDSPLGPFTKATINPILHGSGPVKGAGHHSIVQVPGCDEWVIAYHRFRIPDGNGYNRETCLSPLRYAEDGSILPMDVFETVSLKDSALVTSNYSLLPGAASPAGINLALVATPSASYVSGDTSVAAINDSNSPNNSLERGPGAYGNWPRTGTQWVEYDWSQPISTKQIEVYWWDDHQGVRLPKACRIKFWNGNQFIEITNASGLGVDADKFNVTTFGEVTTTKLRLEMDGNENFSTGILEWRVVDSGKSPDFPPKVRAGVDRDVMLNGKTYLSGAVKFFKPNASSKILWSKSSGPGEVNFADVQTDVTTATFSKPGDYVLKLTAGEGKLASSSTLKVKVVTPPPADRLDVVYTKRYQIDNPLWNAKAKALIVTWIPHCIGEINRTNIPANQGDGGIDNFVEAAKALRGEPHAPHKGYVFANA
jgi:GH43 family beta-xylosidase